MMKSSIQKVMLNITSPKRLGRNIVAVSHNVLIQIAGLFILVILTLPLMFRYRKCRVPFRQTLMLDTAIKFTRLLDVHEIDYVLLTGSLLGSIRQKAFAGRPRDFDLAIKKQDRNKLLDLVCEFKKNGLCMYEATGRRDAANGFILAFPNALRFQDKWAEIDIHTYLEHGSGWRWDRWDLDIPKITFEIDFPELAEQAYSEIFGYKFKIPSNWEDYLVALYGENWRLPDSKQYAWRV